MCGPRACMGGTISTVGPPGKVSVFFPRSITQRLARMKSSPNIQGSCTTATHTLKIHRRSPYLYGDHTPPKHRG